MRRRQRSSLTILLGLLAVLLAGCTPAESTATTQPDVSGDETAPEAQAASPAAAPGPAAAPAPDAGPTVRVRMTTSLGDIVLELDREHAPESVRNFLRYADRGYYDGTIFHRVMAGFMIQGGGLTPDMQKKPTDPPIVNEWRNGLKNRRGTVAMARLGGDADSATSQFFINVVDNGGLDQPQPDGAAYAVFGRVVEGMDVVDAIRMVPTGVRAGRRNVPQEPVIIERVQRVDAG
ncbi:MAG: peptidylprolyl isomerase [Planctomycetota bacterium]|jgi:peptidyl-prolyl cis-trans isomerase A (cyclophilin A)